MKQYLMMCNENFVEQLKLLLLPQIQFLEVQGFLSDQEKAFNFLVTPVVPVIPPVSDEVPINETQQVVEEVLPE